LTSTTNVRNIDHVTDTCLLSNHGLVLLCIAREPGIRLREIADRVGITERAVHRIVCELCEADYVTRTRDGRRNSYELHPEAELRPDMLGGATVGDLIGALEPTPA
jgi:DNA-binding MarR family transcriptional regulator